MQADASRGQRASHYRNQPGHGEALRFNADHSGGAESFVGMDTPFGSAGHA